MLKTNRYMGELEKYIEEYAKRAMDNILNERLSIASEVKDCANYLCNLLCEKFKQGEFKNVNTEEWVLYNEDGWPFKAYAEYYTYSFKADAYVHEKIENATDISCTIINFKSEEEFRGIYGQIAEVGDVDINTLKLHVVAPSVNGTIRQDLLVEILFHELEHLYQLNKGQQIASRRLMSVAQNLLQDNNSKISNCIGKLLYFLDTMEINSKINEIYTQLKETQIKSGNDIGKCYGYQEFLEVIEMHEWLKVTSQEMVKKILSLYKIKEAYFWKYIERQIAYFKRKLRKVVALYFSEKIHEERKKEWLRQDRIKNPSQYNGFSDVIYKKPQKLFLR